MKVGAEEVKRKEELKLAGQIAATVPRINILRYSIVQQILWGSVAGTKFGPVEAPSGAGQDGVSQNPVGYSAWHPGRAVNQKKGVRGGAIVPGWWLVAPEKLSTGEGLAGLSWGTAPTGNSLRILPYQLAGGGTGYRNSFYIHGTGGGGSDGCILIAPTQRTVLVALVSKNGGAWLHAYLSGQELEKTLQRSDKFNSTA